MTKSVQANLLNPIPVDALIERFPPVPSVSKVAPLRVFSSKRGAPSELSSFVNSPFLIFTVMTTPRVEADDANRYVSVRGFCDVIPETIPIAVFLFEDL